MGLQCSDASSKYLKKEGKKLIRKICPTLANSPQWAVDTTVAAGPHARHANICTTLVCIAVAALRDVTL